MLISNVWFVEIVEDKILTSFDLIDLKVTFAEKFYSKLTSKFDVLTSKQNILTSSVWFCVWKVFWFIEKVEDKSLTSFDLTDLKVTFVEKVHSKLTSKVDLLTSKQNILTSNVCIWKGSWFVEKSLTLLDLFWPHWPQGHFCRKGLLW